MKNSRTTQPHVVFDLDPVLESYCRHIFETPEDEDCIKFSRSHLIGLTINSCLQVSESRDTSDYKNPVTFIVPKNGDNSHYLNNHFLKLNPWSLQKVKDAIKADFRSWVRQRFEIGYFKNYRQEQIVYAILRGLNVRSNTASFDMIKKLDYRCRRKKENKRFTELLNIEINGHN